MRVWWVMRCGAGAWRVSVEWWMIGGGWRVGDDEQKLAQTILHGTVKGGRICSFVSLKFALLLVCCFTT